MKVLVIGGTGFIGLPVTHLLVQQGHRVAILHRGKTTANVPAEVHRIHGNRDALAAVRPEIARFGPDVVLDVIAYTEAQARELLAACRGVAERIVALSSADVYRNYDGFRGQATAPPDAVPLAEDAPLRENLYPYRGYGVRFEWADDYEKILVERVLMGDRELPGTALRLPAVYGPGDKQHRVGEYLDRMRTSNLVLMTKAQSEWRWTRAYVENVAAAIVLAVLDRRAAGRIYNVGDESALTEREWAEAIARAIDWPGNVVVVPADQPEEPRPPFDFRYELMTDTTRIRNELGFRDPVGREEALRRTIQWENGQRRNQA